MNRAVTWVVVAAVVILGAWLIFANRGDDGVDNNGENTNGSSNVVNGTGDDKTNFPVVGTQATADDIVIDKPKIGDKVTSPLTVTGRARGPWYFEASSPVMVVDTTGKILGQGFVMAEGEWMTTEFVPFSGTIRWSGPSTEAGAIIFMNDNPSGLPDRSKYMAVPVFFE